MSLPVLSLAVSGAAAAAAASVVTARVFGDHSIASSAKSKAKSKSKSTSIKSTFSSSTAPLLASADALLFFLVYGYIVRHQQRAPAAPAATLALHELVAATAAAACARVFSPTTLLDGGAGLFARRRRSAAQDLALALEPGLAFCLQQLLGLAAEQTEWLQRLRRRRPEERYSGRPPAMRLLARAALDTTVVFVLAAASKAVSTTLTYPLYMAGCREDGNEEIEVDVWDNPEERRVRFAARIDPVDDEMDSQLDGQLGGQLGGQMSEGKIVETDKQVEAAQSNATDATDTTAVTTASMTTPATPPAPSTTPVITVTPPMSPPLSAKSVVPTTSPILTVPVMTVTPPPTPPKSARHIHTTIRKRTVRPRRPLSLYSGLPRVLARAALTHGITMAGQRLLYAAVLRLVYAVAGAISRLVDGRRARTTNRSDGRTRAAQEVYAEGVDRVERMEPYGQHEPYAQYKHEHEHETSLLPVIAQEESLERSLDQSLERSMERPVAKEAAVAEILEAPVQMEVPRLEAPVRVETPTEMEAERLEAPTRMEVPRLEASRLDKPFESTPEAQVLDFDTRSLASTAPAKEMDVQAMTAKEVASPTPAEPVLPVETFQPTRPAPSVPHDTEAVLSQKLPTPRSLSDTDASLPSSRQESAPFFRKDKPFRETFREEKPFHESFRHNTPFHEPPFHQEPPARHESSLALLDRKPDPAPKRLDTVTVPSAMTATKAPAPPASAAPPVTTLARARAPSVSVSAPVDGSLQEDVAARLRSWSNHGPGDDFYGYSYYADEEEGTVIYNMISRTQRVVR